MFLKLHVNIYILTHQSIILIRYHNHDEEELLLFIIILTPN